MEFTNNSYKRMLQNLKKNGYRDVTYDSCGMNKKEVILRHDIDLSLKYALKFSEIEKEEGMHAVYFILLKTNFYNIASLESGKFVKEIVKNGGQIGLHFDETAYEENADILEMVKKEADILGRILDVPIQAVSMHRPSDRTLRANYRFEGLMNSYGYEFMNNFKYISDSRRRWRENVDEIIETGKYDRLHILTHAFWYREAELPAREVLLEFIHGHGISDLYSYLKANIRDLEEFLMPEDIEYDCLGGLK